MNQSEKSPLLVAFQFRLQRVETSLLLGTISVLLLFIDFAISYRVLFLVISSSDFSTFFF
jgi:hypothetical protein